jgi:hypothetical protein
MLQGFRSLKKWKPTAAQLKSYRKLESMRENGKLKLVADRLRYDSLINLFKLNGYPLP